MFGKVFAWFLELFRKKPKQQEDLESKKDQLEEQLKELKDEKMSTDDITDHFNK